VQGARRDDREWEHWPGRGSPDDGIRRRLRSLFAATDDEDAIDALITDRSRELDEQSERLQRTIESLERREEQAAKLRSAVEEMLRHGSAELDERHAELAALAIELRAREEDVRAQERDLAVRKQELGAVELRRAAVERREEAASEREAALERVAAELSDRARDLESPATAASLATPSPEPEAGTHLLYVSREGWQLVERDGPAPPVGGTVAIDGESLVVVRTGRSPLPGDPRACVYLEPARTS